MAKAAFERTKPHLNVAVIGHVDHGKTTLATAITKVLSERGLGRFVNCEDLNQPAEKERGITIVPKFIEYETENYHYTHIDCPGHADYVKNLLWSVSQADYAILVVSADDGPMPQTREHILCARQMGISGILVFLNEKYSDDEELIELVELETRELLSKYDFPGDDCPIVRGSALKALEMYDFHYLRKGTKTVGAVANGTLIMDESGEYDCINELLREMDSYFSLPERPLDKPFMMTVGNIYNIKGRGTVVRGKVLQGTIEGTDKVEIVGFGGTRKSAVKVLEMLGKTLSEGQAGDDLAILLGDDIKRSEIKRGVVVCKPGTVTLYNHVETEVYFLRREEGGKHTPAFSGYHAQMYCHTWDIEAKMELPEGTEMVMPGDNAKMTWKLIKPMPLNEGVRISLRDDGRTIGAGVISKILPNVCEKVISS